MDQQTQQILGYIWPLIVIQFGIQIFAIVDVVRKKQTKNLSVPVWIIVIICGNLLGAIAYLLVGKADDTGD